MATPGILDVTPAQIEVVEREMQTIFEENDQLSGRVRKNQKVVTVSRYLYRAPFMRYRGGATRKVSLNNASLGSGTGMKLGNFEGGYISTVRAYRVTDEQIRASAERGQSTINVLSETVSHAIDDAMVDDDIMLHGDGTGLLTNASSAQTTTVQTFAGATDTLGINRLREGMTVDVWKSDLSVNLGGAQIIAIDYTAKTVTFDAAVTNANVQTNVLAFQGLAAYGPATPTSFSSTWPDRTVAGGLGGDSFRHGLYYINDVTGTDYYLGVLRSSVPQINASRVNASGGGITFDHGQLMLDNLIQRRTINDGSELTGIAGTPQRSAIQKLGTTINNVFIQSSQGDAGKSKDLLPTNHGYKDSTQFCGMELVVSKRQYKDRIDFPNLTKMFRTELNPIRFYTDQNGDKFFEGRGSDGTVQTFTEFFIEGSYDFGSLDPGSGGYVDNLQVPTGY